MGSESLFVKCKACGKEISSKAPACPSCGEKQKKIKKRYWIAIIIGVFILIGLLNSSNEKNSTNSTSISDATTTKSSSSKSQTSSVNKPDKQVQFEKIVMKYVSIYKQAKNELQKSSSQAKRSSEIATLLSSFQIQSWAGTIKELSTNTEGKAILSVRINPNIEIKTWNNALSDILANTLIEQNSQLYNQLMELSIGRQVYFSGSFFNGDKDYIEETSMTEEGAMVNPEFLMKFTNITIIN